MQNTVQVRDRQNLLDIAIQEGGTAEAVFAFALLNGLSITDELNVGQLLKKAGVTDETVTTVFFKENRKPATSASLEDILDGIGYWIVGDDNIVQ